MGTRFSEIHHMAISRFSDYSFLKLPEKDRESLLDRYLMSADRDVQSVCNIILPKDEYTRQYNEDLSEVLKEVLACGEAYYWILPKLYNTRLLRNGISTKDVSVFSPANLLKEISALKDFLYEDFRKKMIEYSYDIVDVSQLKA